MFMKWNQDLIQDKQEGGLSEDSQGCGLGNWVAISSIRIRILKIVCVDEIIIEISF